MRKLRLITLFAALIAAGPSLAFDGHYGENCASDGGSATFRISEGLFTTDQFQCRMSYPTEIRGMEGAVLYDVACFSLLSSWEERILLQHIQNDGLVLVWPGGAQILQRCE